MRGGACTVLMFLLVGAKVLCFESSTLACLEEADGCGTLLVLRDDYPKRELSLSGLTPREYEAFLAWLRESLGSAEHIWTLPVLRSRGSVPLSQRFVLVDITNYAGETATLAVDVTNVYIVGYRVGNHSFFTRPEDDDTREAINRLFEGTERHTFTFTGSYVDLERAAGGREGTIRRDTIGLGTGALDAAVTTMNLYANNPTPTILHSVARGLIVCIQMISEAARFRYIEFEMKSRIRRNIDSEPDPSIIELENSWSALSDQIQMSHTDGVFQSSIQLQRRNYSRFHVSDVQTVLPFISLLLFYCQTPPSPKLLHHHHHHPVIPTIRLVTSDGDPTCPEHVESMWHIVGPDGLCVDVRDGQYNNGNPVQLWPCRSYDDTNQLWTFSSDGTLRSNGKCLASYGNKPRDYIMIYDCDPGLDKFIWHSWPNGTIASATGLVLSTYSTANGTTLSARENAYTTGQSWLPTNSTDPSVHQISGLSGLYCLHADGDDDVVLRECDNMEDASRWALYHDSSIRPHQRRHLCLAPPDTQVDRPLKIARCNPNSPLQRWLFGSDGTIISFSTDLVMDVRGSAVSGAHLTLNAPQGTATQEWQALL